MLGQAWFSWFSLRRTCPPGRRRETSRRKRQPNMTLDPTCHCGQVPARLRSFSLPRRHHIQNPNSESAASRSHLNCRRLSKLQFSNSEPTQLFRGATQCQSLAIRASRIANPDTKQGSRRVLYARHRDARHRCQIDTPIRVESLLTDRKQSTAYHPDRHTSHHRCMPCSLRFFIRRIEPAPAARASIAPGFASEQRPLRPGPVLQFTVPAKEQFNERIGVQP
jgi:hypothetical protein